MSRLDLITIIIVSLARCTCGYTSLSFLITREQSNSMEMSRLMEKELLLSRFDKVEVDSLLLSWQRIRKLWEGTLQEMEFMVHFNCEEVAIPF